MTLTIRKAGDPVLRRRARPLIAEEVVNSKIQDLIDGMVDAMRKAPGVGLAAPQVGYPLQIVVIEDLAKYQRRFSERELRRRGRRPIPLQVLVNPRVIGRRLPRVTEEEGCLSIPGFSARTARYRCVDVKAWNRGNH